MSSKRARSEKKEKGGKKKKQRKEEFAPWLFEIMEGTCEYNVYYFLRPLTAEGKTIITKVEALIYSSGDDEEEEEEYDMTRYQQLINYLSAPKDYADVLAVAHAGIDNPNLSPKEKKASKKVIDEFWESIPGWLKGYTPDDITRHIGDCKTFACENYPRLDEPVIFRSFMSL